MEDRVETNPSRDNDLPDFLKTVEVQQLPENIRAVRAIVSRILDDRLFLQPDFIEKVLGSRELWVSSGSERGVGSLMFWQDTVFAPIKFPMPRMDLNNSTEAYKLVYELAATDPFFRTVFQQRSIKITDIDGWIKEAGWEEDERGLVEGIESVLGEPEFNADGSRNTRVSDFYNCEQALQRYYNDIKYNPDISLVNEDESWMDDMGLGDNSVDSPPPLTPQQEPQSESAPLIYPNRILSQTGIEKILAGLPLTEESDYLPEDHNPAPVVPHIGGSPVLEASEAARDMDPATPLLENDSPSAAGEPAEQQSLMLERKAKVDQALQELVALFENYYHLSVMDQQYVADLGEKFDRLKRLLLEIDNIRNVNQVQGLQMVIQEELEMIARITRNEESIFDISNRLRSQNLAHQEQGRDLIYMIGNSDGPQLTLVNELGNFLSRLDREINNSTLEKRELRDSILIAVRDHFRDNMPEYPMNTEINDLLQRLSRTARELKESVPAANNYNSRSEDTIMVQNSRCIETIMTLVQEIQHLNTSTSEQVILNDNEEEDPMLGKAQELVQQYGRLSASLLQRRLGIGNPRAVMILEQLEQKGLINKPEGSQYGYPVE